jgi:CubicO group peptidase (beta-lactamase class C family)
MKLTLRGLALSLATAAGLLAPSPPPVSPEAEARPSYRVLPEERATRAQRQTQRQAQRRTASRPPARPRPAARPQAASRPAAAAAAVSAAPAVASPPPPTVAVPVRPPRPGARLGAGELPPTAELEAFVDGLVRDAMATEHIAGVAVSVVGGNQLLLSKGYGFADYTPRPRPVDPSRTLFRLGSVSKTFTWIALMQQVEDGRISLDAPVNAYLPESAQVPDRRRWRAVQIRDLLTHTPGFEDRALGHLIEREPDQVRPLLTYLAEEQPRRVRAPGRLPTYSNYGAAIAGAAAAQAAGAPYVEVIERRVTGPLGMSRTTFREPYPVRSGLPAPMSPALAADLSEGFRWTGAGYAPRPTEFLSQTAPAGGASATAGDMARFMTAILNDGVGPEGGRIYGPETARAFRTVLQRSAPGVNGWAHGFMEYNLPGGFTGYGHGGATLSFYSSLVTVPELGLGVFVTTNTDTGRPLVERLPALLVERFYASPPGAPPPGSEALEDRGGDFAGTYLTTRRAYGGLEGFASRLSGTTAVRVSEDGRLLTPVGNGIQAWTPEGPNGLETGRFRSTSGDERLVFQLRNGRAVGWYAPWGGASYERQSAWRSPVLLAALANLAALAAILTLVGAVLRRRRAARAGPAQVRASALELVAALLWITAVGGFAAFAMSASADAANLLYAWPGAGLRIASWAALLAAAVSVALLLLLITTWRSESRGGWTLGRRLRHTATVLVYVAAAAVLGSWGALQPWTA